MKVSTMLILIKENKVSSLTLLIQMPLLKSYNLLIFLLNHSGKLLCNNINLDMNNSKINCHHLCMLRSLRMVTPDHTKIDIVQKLLIMQQVVFYIIVVILKKSLLPYMDIKAHGMQECTLQQLHYLHIYIVFELVLANTSMYLIKKHY